VSTVLPPDGFPLGSDIFLSMVELPITDLDLLVDFPAWGSGGISALIGLSGAISVIPERMDSLPSFTVNSDTALPVSECVGGAMVPAGNFVALIVNPDEVSGVINGFAEMDGESSTFVVATTGLIIELMDMDSMFAVTAV